MTNLVRASLLRYPWDNTNNWDATTPNPRGIFNGFRTFTNEVIDTGWMRRHVLPPGNHTSNVTFEEQTYKFGRGRLVIAIGDPKNPSEDIVDGVIYPIYRNVPSLDGSTSAAIEQANLKFLLKCEQAYHTFQGSTFIAEIRDTVRQIRHPYQAAVRYLAARTKRLKTYMSSRKIPVKHGLVDVSGRSRSQKRELKDLIDSSWLETRFGVLPLIGDMNSLGEGLASLTNKMRLVPLSATSQQINVRSGSPFTDGTRQGEFTVRSKRTFEVRVTTRGEFANYFPKEAHQAWNTTLGFDWGSAVCAGYEIIPWSFALDYFYNLGAFLQALSVPQSNILWSNQTIRIRDFVEQIILADSLKAQNHYGKALYCNLTGDCSMSSSYRKVQRYRLGVIPVPMPRFQLPGLSLKWLNLAALASQRL